MTTTTPLRAPASAGASERGECRPAARAPGGGSPIMAVRSAPTRPPQSDAIGSPALDSGQQSFFGGRFPRNDASQPAAVHDEDAIRQTEDLRQLGGDDDDPFALSRQLDQIAVDL